MRKHLNTYITIGMFVITVISAIIAGLIVKPRNVIEAFFVFPAVWIVLVAILFIMFFKILDKILKK